MVDGGAVIDAGAVIAAEAVIDAGAVVAAGALVAAWVMVAAWAQGFFVGLIVGSGASFDQVAKGDCGSSDQDRRAGAEHERDRRALRRQFVTRTPGSRSPPR